MKKIIAYWQKHTLLFAYLVVLLIGLVGTVLSFSVGSDRISYVCCGIGTGALASLIVSLLMNRANTVRTIQERERTRSIVLHDLNASAIKVYHDTVLRLDRFLLFTDAFSLPEAAMYDDPDTYLSFLDRLETLDFKNCSGENRSQLTALLDYPAHDLSTLYSELRKMPRQEYYLQGLLSEEEFKACINNQEIAVFQKAYEGISGFWNPADKTVLNYQQCIRFLKITVHTCVRTLHLDPDAGEKVKACEDGVREELSNFCSGSDGACGTTLFHTENSSDAVLRELYWSVFGAEDKPLSGDIADIDPNDPKIHAFFERNDVRSALRKGRRRHELQSVLGNEKYHALLQKINHPRRTN